MGATDVSLFVGLLFVLYCCLSNLAARAAILSIDIGATGGILLFGGGVVGAVSSFQYRRWLLRSILRFW